MGRDVLLLCQFRFLSIPASGGQSSSSPERKANSRRAAGRGRFIRDTLHNAEKFADDEFDEVVKNRPMNPVEAFLITFVGEEEDNCRSELTDSGCSLSLLPPCYEKFVMSEESRTVQFCLASNIYFIGLQSDKVKTCYLPVKDKMGRVRLVPEKAVIHSSVSRALFAYTKKELYLGEESGRPSWLRLTDIDGNRFVALVDQSSSVPLVLFFETEVKDQWGVASAYLRRSTDMAVQPAKSLHSYFFSACAGEGKDETSLSTENKKHLLYVLHFCLAYATGERLLLTLREKGVGLSYSLQECRESNVWRKCRACREVNFRRRRLKRRGWKAKKHGKRKRAGAEEAPSGVGVDDESKETQGSNKESSLGDRRPSEKFNRIIYHDIKDIKKKSYGGFRYISVIVDWKFRRVSLKALQSKDHAERHLLSWIRRWEVADFGKPLIVRSDNGGEFLGEEGYLRMCENEGVDNEFGPPGTLEHVDAEGELLRIDLPRSVCSSMLKGILMRESNGALFPVQIVREREQQLRGTSITRLKKQEDGSFCLAEFDRIAQKDIVERFDLPAEGKLPESILQCLAEEAP
uniref:Integrase catalytic domain-containing protein n=1 Tax=Chromera velia CCMP2878 TaxID=1169474 RepID=A0A0G4HWP6_9ALVE|eukprot:Cvel_9064.t1-p1 / transcript=Cvel_9064.t1 / gene=Cvel_9064 / organism=Chromera_velia_CCMP2878 / gene_product=hypothetical protein / transcript_product=hypothetical protein / location=Cvel_scaffold514:25367-27645(-) / protein_length=574 / sequence_SO=supercontig / SO=protein_coding / is_pseudo=false